MKGGHADVIIVGAGATGLSAAYELAKAGLRTLVFDKSGLADEGAGKSGSNIRLVGRSNEDLPLMRASIKKWHVLPDELGCDLGLRLCGNLWIAFSDKEQAEHLALMERDRAAGFRVEALDDAHVQEFVPALARVVGAVFSPDSCISNPFKVCFAWWNAARRLGAEFHFGTDVLSLLTSGNRVTGVQTTKGNYFADTVIVAAGPWSPFLVKSIGIDLPISNLPYQKVITEAVSPTLPCFILTAAGSFHQAKEGQIHMGHGAATPGRGFSTAPDADEMRRTTLRMQKVLPCVENFHVLRSWIGFLDMTPDDNFIFGGAECLQGLVLACGFCGHGYGLAPIVGELLSEYVTNDKTSLPMDAFLLKRFHVGEGAGGKSHFTPR